MLYAKKVTVPQQHKYLGEVKGWIEIRFLQDFKITKKYNNAC